MLPSVRQMNSITNTLSTIENLIAIFSYTINKFVFFECGIFLETTHTWRWKEKPINVKQFTKNIF